MCLDNVFTCELPASVFIAPPRPRVRRGPGAEKRVEVETNALGRRHPAWFVHSEPMTSDSGLLPLLPTPRATPDCTGYRTELLPANAQALIDKPSNIMHDMQCTLS